MPTYAYEAQTQSGESIADTLTAASVSAAIQELEARGLIVRSIRTLGEELASPAEVETPTFYRRVEAALAHREALIAALEAYADDIASKSSDRDLRALIGELRRGATAQDFIQHESAAAWLPLILRSPAMSLGSDGFQILLSEAARESDNHSARRRMLVYPLTVLAVALVLSLALLYAVVPVFAQMYREFGLNLPTPTRTVIWLSDRLRESTLLFFAVVVLSALVFFALFRMWLSHALTSRLLGTLIAGNSLSVGAIARFTSTLGELLALEAPLPDAIRIAGRASQHPYYRQMADALAQDARRGPQTLDASRVACAFPANVIHALRADRDNGPSVPLLRELSVLYSQRVSQRFDWSAGIVGPLTIVVAGVLVGFFVLALLMPLVRMISVLS